MEDLLQDYKAKLDAIKAAIQNSEELTAYLDEEEEEQYRALIEKFEGQIHEIYMEVANNHPLQIVSLENLLLDPEFEGLYLPKALGYTVLRGQINENVEYERPQKHFKKVLEFINGSSNFDQIKKRVGQSIQVGFALSSDIWITNIINAAGNKQVKNFLESQNQVQYHDIRNRKTAYVKYSKQFQSLNFYTADFPQDTPSLIREFRLLKSFLLYRSENHSGNNADLSQKLSEFLSASGSFNQDPRYLELIMIIGMKYELSGPDKMNISNYFDELRKDPDFEAKFFNLIVRLHDEIDLNPESELKLIDILDTMGEDKISLLYKVLKIVHTEGYMNEDAINASRDFYYLNEGLSPQNTALRKSVFYYFKSLLSKLTVADYADYFEINKVMIQYINVFGNQQFNQDIKDSSLKYIKKLLKHYTDKRGRDYQDIKKYVWSSFVDLNFMSEKELKEFFKTKRKAKPTA